MTSISSMLTGFFQLPTSPASSGTSSTSSDSTSSTTMPSLAQALAAVDSSDSSSDNSSDSAFTLNLSDDAQSYLQSLSSVSSSSSGTGSAAGSGFILSTKQQQQVTDIINKYKDAPYDQDTYDSIQNDLKAAGLSPQQLGLEDQIRKFSPVSELVDDLSGQSSNSSPIDFGNSPDETANANAYMQGIVNQWQAISTTAGAAASGTGSASGASGTGNDTTSGSAAS